MPEEASVRTKLLAGGSLTLIMTSVGVLYKASQANGGGFEYSTTSAITMAEACKCLISGVLHMLNHSPAERSIAIQRDVAALPASAIGHILLLSFIYALNNQVSFFVYTKADPGTVYLFKAGATSLTATVQCLFVGKTFTTFQWEAMVLQAVGIVIVQFDPCHGRTMYSAGVYFMMAGTVVLTVISSARNEFLVKNYTIPLNILNFVLYAGGFVMNLLAFVVLPNPNSKQQGLSFFHGYDNPLAVAVVIVNALIGLAITVVYKYADAIVKCISADVTSLLLVVISSRLFNVQMTLTGWLGVFVCLFGVTLYLQASRLATQAAKVDTIGEAHDKELEHTDASGDDSDPLVRAQLPQDDTETMPGSPKPEPVGHTRN